MKWACLVNLIAAAVNFGIWQENVSAGIGLFNLMTAVMLYVECKT